MNRLLWRLSKAGRAGASLLAGLFLWVSGVPDAGALDDLQWLHSDADPVDALTRTPAECVATPDNPEQIYLMRVGRVAFRSPFLLGGVAARSGISCNTCHRNGHGNPHFFIEGVSDEAGTADVTGAVFSKTRDDGLFNPVPIPSLVDAVPPFGTIMPSATLEDFLAHAIRDEFQGRTPPPVVMRGLTAYLNALRSAGCPERRMEPVSLAADIKAADEAYGVLIGSLERADLATADFLLIALQAALERVYQRFPPLIAARDGLVTASTALRDVRSLIVDDPAGAIRALHPWRDDVSVTFEALARQEDASFYNARVLRHGLTGPGPK